jgi:hypothetical protein
MWRVCVCERERERERENPGFFTDTEVCVRAMGEEEE